MPCERESLGLQYPLPIIHHRQHKTWIIRDTLSSLISGRYGIAVLTTCLLWTLTPYITGTSHRISVFRRRRSRRRRIIWSPSSINFVTSPPLLCWCMASSAWRRRIWLNAYPAASRQNGSNHTCGCAYTSRVGWPSHCIMPPTTAYGVPGCHSTR